MFNIQCSMTKPKFTYGDRIRRKSGGPVETVHDLNDTAYYFEGGGFCLREDEDCYRLEEKATGFFLVSDTLDGAPLRDHSSHGYEELADFRRALQQLVERWGGRTGQYVGSRHQFLRLKFRDMPGGGEEAWLPLYLLQPCPIPDYLKEKERDPFDKELDHAFGFE